jgi:hypothetical protein
MGKTTALALIPLAFAAQGTAAKPFSSHGTVPAKPAPGI